MLEEAPPKRKSLLKVKEKIECRKQMLQYPSPSPKRLMSRQRVREAQKPKQSRRKRNLQSWARLKRDNRRKKKRKD